ncbi:uncharacterized protein LOC123895945 [Trifolium pratense]|uniref:uncharacterized protein LOC123895945 n=1 Tax=Trifolium pratense TaxID=57577 RepID=UPI001E693567|nr:uncharacterized protein LOC123895945 [Trifolium pratense]
MNVTSVPFKLSDDLNLLETYNWGQVVYEDLVESINTTANKYAQSGRDSSKEMILSGCSAILQLVEDLVPTEEDQQFDVVAEAIRQSEVMHTNDIYTSFDATAVLRKQQILFDHNKAFREKISMIAEEMKLLKEADKGGKEESRLGNEGGEEESELVGKQEDNGREKVIESVKKVEDKKRCQELIKHLYETCTTQSRANV